MMPPISLIVAVGLCLSGCTNPHSPLNTSAPVIRGGWTVDVLHEDFEGDYAIEVVSATNKKLEQSVREEFSGLHVECYLVANLHGFQVVFLAPRALDESEEARIDRLITLAVREVIQERVPAEQQRANQSPETRPTSRPVSA